MPRDLSGSHGSCGEGREPEGTTVAAAGGMVVRRSTGGVLEVVVVHRPLRQDWTFPKGKADGGETLEECAIREVEEETRYACLLGPFVGHTEYPDWRGVRKSVSYWLMERVSGDFAPGEEVDELRWVEVDAVASVLTYERDRDLLVRLRAVSA